MRKMMIRSKYFRTAAMTVLAACILLAGCGGQGKVAESTEAITEAGADAQTEAQLETETQTGSGEQTEGEAPEGYVLTDSSEDGILQSKLRTYVHEQSGATLVCIDNDDQELAFGIFYNTPVVDETDTNHVFEHAIIASSEKYPSKDLFFDLANKSYNTFINAFTYDAFTGYPVSSMSEDQLLSLIDAYMSCMAAPGVLEDENFFKREAIRYELRDPDDPIEITGTVYAEDFGSLTDIDRESLNNVADALYPGQVAANSIGRAHRNYQSLTYEHTIETYERCYSFDNSLIILYGNMDYDRVMSFLDEEYLSKAEGQDTDLSAYMSEETEPGYVETVVECPAFTGDTSENVSIIDYAISLEDMDWKDLICWDILSSFMNQENSEFNECLREAGIYNQAEVGLNVYCMKPYLLFRLYQAEEEQAAAFKEAVITVLSRIAEEGIDADIVSTVLKQLEIANYQIRDTRNAGVNIAPNIVNYWVHTGEVDYYGLYEEAFSDMSEDQEQAIIKRLTASALEPERSALVTTVPVPGLAEEIIAERDQYLADMKAAMTEEEIAQLIADTEAFDEWNAMELTNSDFVIDPAEVDIAEPYMDFEVTEEEGMSFYTAAAEVEEIGRYALYLDSSALDNEDILYLDLYMMMLGMLPTEQYSEDEAMALYAEYLDDMSFTALYPEGPEAEAAHPMVKFMWTGLTGDHKESLKLLLEFLSGTDVSDGAKVLEIVDRYKDSLDLSRTSDMITLASNVARIGISANYDYKMLFEGQDRYYFMEDVSRRLSEDGGYINEVVAGIEAARDKLLTRHALIYVCAAPEEELAVIQSDAMDILSTLPEGEASEMKAQPADRVRRLGIEVESPDQYIVNYSNIYKYGEMEGRYLPYINAVTDRYLIPLVRFQNGAYSASISVIPIKGDILQYSYSDPNVGVTIDVFDGTGDAVRELELTEEDLDGYKLYTLSTTGLEYGVLSGPMQSMELDILGFDLMQGTRMLQDVKNATLEDKDAAAEAIAQVFAEGNICAVGNGANLKADEDRFDEIVSYRGYNR